MNELQGLYRQTLRRRIVVLESAREALLGGDTGAAEIILQIAHKLKGSGGTYGYPKITAAAESLFSGKEELSLTQLDELLAIIRKVAFEEEK